MPRRPARTGEPDGGGGFRRARPAAARARRPGR
jgi:hypothetical protein